MQDIKGTLIPIGGNEDKGLEESEIYHLEFIDEGILYHVVKEAGGTNANIVVIPTASSIPDEVGENYLSAFSKLGCKNVTILDIRSKKDSKKSQTVELIKKANCVMFSGGNQSKITDKIGGSVIHEILRDRYLNEEGFVIAGTSAGAMAMAQEMIAGGSAVEAFVKGAVTMYKGLGLINELIIDTHFIRRGRFGRQAEAVAKHPELIGVGLAEDTGMIIKNGNDCTVIGSGMVIIFDGSNLTHNNEKLLDDGTPMTMTNLTVHVLSNSDSFHIKDRKVNVLPIEAPFI
ncbi:MAG: cyanophycinase [Bacteroidia bacterium]|nr:cyanophycinase [Bacteroidia bacterium]NND25023.1 cyanophycinase [Flavobacteriaceae bacterium]MBT8278557.1 cyanophycinase [Bacteroidia bacterium]NNK59549.1 cyanophycinase [Flavobacteriaceae bacterium]NNL32486.1 cyanophycinase [Flavobacteriaceae bacterium]